MKRLITLVVTVLISGGAGVYGQTTRSRCDAARTLRVLFVGNSFTYVQNMPKMVEVIAAGLPGPCITTSMIAIGGATLEQHWKSDSVAQRIRSGGWTHIVFNDQSTFGEMSFVAGQVRIGTSGKELFDYGSRFTKLARNAGATPILIAHWPNAHANQRDRQALDYIFARFQREHDVALAPVGLAITRMRAALPSLNPYFTDDHHLAAAGVYLEALVIYNVLTARAAAGAPHRISGRAVELNTGAVSDSIATLVDIDAGDARVLETIAAAAVAESPAYMQRLAVPAPLAAELPAGRGDGDRVVASDLRGTWRGVSNALPVPGSDSVTVELVFNGDVAADSAHLRGGPVHFRGPARVSVEGTRIVVHATLLPERAPGRSRPWPMELRLEGVMRTGVIEGVTVLVQSSADTYATFNAIGTFRVSRK
jgi:hypothetical protein